MLLQTALPPVKVWYGPATATFRVDFEGNPFDPADNDVRVSFTGPSGAPVERLAYYDPTRNVWRANLVTDRPGRYVAKLMRNGKLKLEAPAEGILEVTAVLPHGYIRRDTSFTQRFRRDDGTYYVPLGVNLGWQNGDLVPMTEQIRKLGQAGANWTRLWACHWDGKNPWWPMGDEEPAAPGQLWGPALNKWQALVETCEATNVPFQFVLFHHGAFSSRVNPNWPDHPWNAKNGGFLKDAADFFTDAEAKRRTRMWLRYAVARWGHSPSIMAWELFNEVEWVDARYADRWPDIEKWHGEMAAYIRSIDPYGHLITTSSAVERPNLWTGLDIVEPHVYSPGVFGAILGTTPPADKPMMYGEFGADDMGRVDVRQVARDGMLGGLFGNHAGAGQFWYWDYTEKQGLYSEFTNVAHVIKASSYATHPFARPIAVGAETEGRSNLVLKPGGGWQKTTRTTFNLPNDATAANTRELSAYLQGEAGNNRDMFPGGLTLHFRAAAPGVVRVRLAEASKTGGGAYLGLDGKTVAQRDFAAGTDNRPLTDVLEAPFGPGEHTVTLKNPGMDWVRVAAVEVTGIAPQAQATGLADTKWAMVRLTAAPEATSPNATLLGLPFVDGTHLLTTVDLDSGQSTEGTIAVKNRRAIVPLKKDVILVIREK